MVYTRYSSIRPSLDKKLRWGGPRVSLTLPLKAVTTHNDKAVVSGLPHGPCTSLSQSHSYHQQLHGLLELRARKRPRAL